VELFTHRGLSIGPAVRYISAALFLAAALASAALADPFNDALRRRDYATALQIVRPLADQGQAPAQHNLAMMYRRGLGVPQSMGEAVRLLRLAAAQGFGPAQSDLGRAYAEGLGVDQDDREALRLFRLAAAQGSPEGEYNLGLMYQRGRGVARDEWYAARLFRSAATAGLDEAQFALGLMYSTGRGAPLEPSTAARWFQSAAEQGHTQSEFHLGLMYREGRGVALDPIIAYVWLSLAASGDLESLEPAERNQLTTTRDQIRGELGGDHCSTRTTTSAASYRFTSTKGRAASWWRRFCAPARRRTARRCTVLKHVVRRIRLRWPLVSILVRGDSHYGRDEAMTWCEANDVAYIFGLAGNATLAYITQPVAEKLRRCCALRYGAKSWPRQRHVVARVEATRLGLDIRYIVTSLCRHARASLRAGLLRARPGGELHQAAQDPARLGSHLVPRPARQPGAIDPTWLRLLAALHAACRSAQALAPAPRRVHHAAHAAHQDRRARRRGRGAHPRLVADGLS
jgi:TPR repeat protein